MNNKDLRQPIDEANKVVLRDVQAQPSTALPDDVHEQTAEIDKSDNELELNTSNVLGKVVQGRLRLDALLGSGGMSTVYRATHLLLNQTVAYKVLHLTRCSDTAILRFQQEGRAATLLNHPQIATVREFGQDESGAPYLVMDYVDGTCLSDILKAGKLDVTRAVNIIAQVCEGLQHAHDRGVVHRDIKPSNIMIIKLKDGSEQVRIVDFGIAKIIDSDGRNLTQTGEIFGTPNYMSPEQCQGQPVDLRTDIYALGCVLYETLTGEPVIKAETPLQAIMQHVSGVVPNFDHQGISADLQAVILKALERDSQRRFKSMQEFRAALCEADLSTGSNWKKDIRNKSLIARRRLNLKLVLWCMLLIFALSTVVHRFQVEGKLKTLSHDTAAAQKRADKLLGLLEQLKLDRSNPANIAAVAGKLETEGRLDLAELAYRRAFKLDPTNKAIERKLNEILAKENGTKEVTHSRTQPF